MSSFANRKGFPLLLLAAISARVVGLVRTVFPVPVLGEALLLEVLLPELVVLAPSEKTIAYVPVPICRCLVALVERMP